MRVVTSKDGLAIKNIGTAYVKKPNPVHMVRVDVPCDVETNSGIMRAESGDWLCYDELSGHVWPITDEYKRQHYDEAKTDIK